MQTTNVNRREKFIKLFFFEWYYSLAIFWISMVIATELNSPPKNAPLWFKAIATGFILAFGYLIEKMYFTTNSLIAGSKWGRALFLKSIDIMWICTAVCIILFTMSDEKIIELNDGLLIAAVFVIIFWRKYIVKKN